MKIWFGTTTLHFQDYKQQYLSIRQHLLDLGHVLTDDWLGKHGKWLEENPYAIRGVKNIYQKVIKAIDAADVSVIEFTVPNFSTSHQITYSLQKRKPTLVMRLKRENTFKDSYIEGIDSPYLHLVNYSAKNFLEVINEFLGYAGIDEGTGRYNIVLDKKTKFYLDWAANRYKVSRSKLLRELVEGRMAEDSEFKIYLQEG